MPNAGTRVTLTLDDEGRTTMSTVCSRKPSTGNWTGSAPSEKTSNRPLSVDVVATDSVRVTTAVLPGVTSRNQASSSAAVPSAATAAAHWSSSSSASSDQPLL